MLARDDHDSMDVPDMLHMMGMLRPAPFESSANLSHVSTARSGAGLSILEWHFTRKLSDMGEPAVRNTTVGHSILYL